MKEDNKFQHFKLVIDDEKNSTLKKNRAKIAEVLDILSISQWQNVIFPDFNDITTVVVKGGDPSEYKNWNKSNDKVFTILSDKICSMMTNIYTNISTPRNTMIIMHALNEVHALIQRSKGIIGYKKVENIIRKTTIGGSLIDNCNAIDSISGNVILRLADNKLRQYKCDFSAENAYCQLTRVTHRHIGDKNITNQLMPQESDHMLVELNANKGRTQLMRCIIDKSSNVVCSQPENIVSHTIPSWSHIRKSIFQDV